MKLSLAKKEITFKLGRCLYFSETIKYYTYLKILSNVRMHRMLQLMEW